MCPAPALGNRISIEPEMVLNKSLQDITSKYMDSDHADIEVSNIDEVRGLVY